MKNTLNVGRISEGFVLDPDRLNAKGYNPSIVKFADLCIGCGMCGMICPDSAITVER